MCILGIVELFRCISKRMKWNCCNCCMKYIERRPKIHRPNRLGIGYTHDGKFDPYHMDFELCCGMFHTGTFVKWVAAFMVILSIVNAIVFSIYTIPYVGMTVLHRIIAEIAIFISIILIFAAVFSENSSLYKEISRLSNSDEKINHQLMLLLLVVLFSIDLLCLVWVTWIMHIHCCYLQAIETIDAIHEYLKEGKYEELEEKLKEVDGKNRKRLFLCCCIGKNDILDRQLTYA